MLYKLAKPQVRKRVRLRTFRGLLFWYNVSVKVYLKTRKITE